MATIFDVARYIVESLGSMTTMKLQKLVYYSQAWHLVWEDEPLFDNDFQAWANGPVCPDLFQEHQGEFRIHEDFLEMKGQSEYLSARERESIDAVIDFYGAKEPIWLSHLSHSEDPWKNARGNCPPGGICNRIIKKIDMQQYYASL